MIGRLSGESGAVAVFVAVMILPLVLLVSFAVDTGNWWTHKRHLQTQADAGAFAGGQGPWFPTCNETAIEQQAASYSGGTYNQQYETSGTVHVHPEVLAVATLAVHGVNDPIAPVDAVRAYAEQLDPLQLKEFQGAHHDILNETVHREVAAAIIDFVEEQAGL